jgi:hypothetical protein
VDMCRMGRDPGGELQMLDLDFPRRFVGNHLGKAPWVMLQSIRWFIQHDAVEHNIL